MKISVLGTGMVGRAVAGRLHGLGYEVAVGTRHPESTRSRTERGGVGAAPFVDWLQQHDSVALLDYGAAAARADVVVNATNGGNSLAALAAAGSDNLAGKVILDVALALDFSAGMPPRLLIANDDSLGEQIQRTYPRSRVVKTLSTVFCEVMVDPARVPGAHSIFVAGDDAAAKDTARTILHQFGWPAKSVLDLGGIRAGRAVELYMPLYFTLHTVLETFDFNVAVVHAG